MAEALHDELLGFDEEILKTEEQLRETQEKLQRLREQRAATQQRLWLIDSKLAALLVGVDGFSPEGVPLILGHVGLGHLWRAAAVCQYLSRVAKELEKEWEVLKISGGTLGPFDRPYDYVSLPAGVAGEAFGIVVEFHPQPADRPALVMVDDHGRRCGTLGPAGAAPGCLRAGGAVYHGNELFVADRNNHRVQKLKLDGTPLAAAAMSYYPSHLCMAAGELYVSAGGQLHVLVARSKSTLILPTGPPPRIVVLDPTTLHENRIIGLGAVEDPKGVAVHGDCCFVADRDRIVVLSATKGQLLRVIGEPMDPDIYPGRPGQLRYPGGIAVVGEHLLVGCLMVYEEYEEVPDDIDDWSEGDEAEFVGYEYHTALQVLTLEGAPRQFLRLGGPTDLGAPGGVRVAGDQVIVSSGNSFVHICELI